jgi:transcription-repair coupling factor (superfamily II helicase)
VEQAERKNKEAGKRYCDRSYKIVCPAKKPEGFAHSPDNYMQTELEASFIFEDTPDQAKATEDVKRDMEKPMPHGQVSMW